MSVIFVNRFFHPDHSATSQLLSDLAFHLAAGGTDVHVVTSRQRYDDPAAELPPRERVRGVTVHRVRTTRFGRGGLAGRAADYATFYPAAAGRVWRLARRGDVVVAKTDPPLIGVATGWVARRRGARSIQWLQDVFPEVAEALGVGGAARWLSAGVLRALRDRSLRAAAANVVLGERMAERIAGRGVAPDRIHRIPNWSDGERVAPVRREANPLRAEWGLGSRFVVGYSGNLGRVHEFGTVVDAAERLRGEHAPTFLFVGGGPRRAALETEVRRRGLERFRFLPYQPSERLSHSLGVPDVHLISLRPEMEGLVFPSKLYGVLAAGRPAIFYGDPRGELAGILQTEACGLAVAQGDDAALARSIARLRDDPDVRSRMGRRARELFERRYARVIALRAWSELLHGR